MKVHPLFQVHLLNDIGKAHANDLAERFTGLLEFIEEVGAYGDPRDLALAKTKLQEACFFAKRAMATAHENQQIV